MYLMGLEKPTELAVLTFAVSCYADALWLNFILILGERNNIDCFNINYPLRQNTTSNSNRCDCYCCLNKQELPVTYNNT